jgi:hypothetical protein
MEFFHLFCPVREPDKTTITVKKSVLIEIELGATGVKLKISNNTD